MKKVVYLSQFSMLESICASNADEVIVCTSLFSRIGSISKQELGTCLKELKLSHKKIIFEWDTLLTQNTYSLVLSQFKSLDLGLVDSFRLMDPGVVNYIFENDTRGIHLNLESSGFHNLKAIKKWVSLFPNRIERVLLSLELESSKLEYFTSELRELDIEVEFLALGRILLFYTPRNLVSPLYEQVDNRNDISVLANSQESPHKGFPIIENRHGTFMFNTKDHFLLDFIKELSSIGLSALRIDTRFIDLELLPKIFEVIESNSNELGVELKKLYPKTVIRGFFHKNKSDALFKKLKNYRILRKDLNYIGEVIEVSKKNHLGVFIRSRANSLKLGNRVLLVTPDGKEKESTLTSITNSNKLEVKDCNYGDIIFIPHVSGISVKTNVYLQG